MAIDYSAEFPTQIATPTASYPFGSGQNVTTSGDNTGTPWDPLIFNDWIGFFGAMLTEASIVPSGTADTVLASQYLDALKIVAGGGGGDFLADGTIPMTGDFNAGTNKIANVGQGGIGPGPGNPSITLSFEGSPTSGLTTVAPDTLYLIQDAANFSTASAVALGPNQAALAAGSTSVILSRGAEDSATFRAGADEKLKLTEISSGVATLDFFGRTSITNLPLGTFGPGGTNLSLSFNGSDDDGIVSTQAGRVALVAGIDNFSSAPTVSLDSGADSAGLNVGSSYIRVFGDTAATADTLVFRVSSQEQMHMTATELDLKGQLRVTSALDPVDPQDLVTKAHGDASYNTRYAVATDTTATVSYDSTDHMIYDELTNVGAITATMLAPAAPFGDLITVRKGVGSGTITFVGDGAVTVRTVSGGSLVLATDGAVASLVSRSATLWDLIV